MTLVEAAAAVLRDADRPLSASEIYEAITKTGSFTFNAKNPEQIVLQQLRRHCVGIQNAQSAKERIFVRTPDGRFALHLKAH